MDDNTSQWSIVQFLSSTIMQKKHVTYICSPLFFEKNVTKSDYSANKMPSFHVCKAEISSCMSDTGVKKLTASVLEWKWAITHAEL